MQDHFALPSADTSAVQGWTTDGTWSLYQTADRMFASRQSPFLVAETNAQAIGHAWSNEPPYDGQWRQAAWALVSRGATMIEYWHWHTLPYGGETYWGGVLPHSLEPGRTYFQLAALGAEFERAGSLVAGIVPDSDVAILWSNAAKWTMEENPILGAGDGGPDHRSYQAIVDSFYRGAFDAGLQVRLLHPSQLFGPGSEPAAVAARHPVLIAAGLIISDDQDLSWLGDYAAAGGHLVLGIRTGYEDHEARARVENAPAGLTGAAGVSYDEFSTLDVPVPVRATEAFGRDLPAGAAATRWIDGLQPVDAEVLVEYEHPHFSRWPAVTTRRCGEGRVTTVGTIPDLALAAALSRWLATDLDGSWRPQADTQTCTGGTAADGTRLRIVHNWSFRPSTFTLPAAVVDVLSHDALREGETLTLGAWDVRVLAAVEG